MGETFTPNADITTAKCLSNSVISKNKSKFLGLDIKDFKTDMGEYEYMCLTQWILPQYFNYENYIEHIFINNIILVIIRKGVYGLPQVGKLSYIAIIKHIQLHVYTHAGFTPGLFKHATQDTMFSLVVDDFGVKHTAKNDALHLIDTLKKNTLESLLIGVAEYSLAFT